MATATLTLRFHCTIMHLQFFLLCMNFVGFQRGSSRTRASRNAIRCGLKQCALYSTSSHTPTCPMFPIFLAPSKGWLSFSTLHRERKRQFWSTLNLHVPRMAQGSDPGHQRCHDLIDIQILTCESTGIVVWVSFPSCSCPKDC